MREYWLTKSIPALRAMLEKRGWRKDVIDRTVEAVKQAKTERKSSLDTRQAHKEQWRSILTPLRQELGNARQGLAYDPHNPLRVAAFEHYCAVLEQAYYRLFAASTYTEGALTPAVLARELTERFEETGKGFAIPNNGVHWSDWVSPKRKAEVGKLFYAWQTSDTRKKHAKFKEPFKRIDRKDDYEVRKDKLLTYAKAEQATIRQKYEICHQAHINREELMRSEKFGNLKKAGRPVMPEHEKLYRRLLKVSRAIELLNAHTREDGALPRTWHGMLPKTKKDSGSVDPE